MPIPLSELRKRGEERRSVGPIPLPIDYKLTIPLNVKATGKEGFIRVQWSPVAGAEGYQVAVSSTANIENPDYGIDVKVGANNTWYDFHIGNLASTYFFGVRAFQGYPPRFLSDFSAVVSALSIATTGVGTGAPAPPSTPPSTTEPPPTGRDGTSGRGRQTL